LREEEQTLLQSKFVIETALKKTFGTRVHSCKRGY